MLRLLLQAIHCCFCTLHRILLCIELAHVSVCVPSTVCMLNKLVKLCKRAMCTRRASIASMSELNRCWFNFIYTERMLSLCIKIYWIHSHLIAHCLHLLQWFPFPLPTEMCARFHRLTRKCSVNFVIELFLLRQFICIRARAHGLPF